MITAIVRFPMPGASLEATALFEGSATRYRDVPGLVRKYYLYSDDGMAGGVYLWQSREQADALYSEAWRQMIAERYGTAPEIAFYETPVIVEANDAAAYAAE